MRKKDALTRASLLSMEYPKPVSPSGAVNYAKNALQAPQAKEDYDSMKENLRLEGENEKFTVKPNLMDRQKSAKLPWTAF